MLSLFLSLFAALYKMVLFLTDVFPSLLVILFLFVISGTALLLCLRKGTGVKTKPNSAYVYYNTNAFPREGLIFTDPAVTALPSRDSVVECNRDSPPPPLPPPFSPSPLSPPTHSSNTDEFKNIFKDTSTFTGPVVHQQHTNLAASVQSPTASTSAGYHEFIRINNPAIVGGKMRSHTMHTSMMGGLSSIGEEGQMSPQRPHMGSCNHLDSGYSYSKTNPRMYGYREPATSTMRALEEQHRKAATPTSIMRGHTATLPHSARVTFSPTPSPVTAEQLNQQTLSLHYSITPQDPAKSLPLLPHSSNQTQPIQIYAPRGTLPVRFESVPSPSRCGRSQTFSGVSDPSDTLYVEMRSTGGSIRDGYTINQQGLGHETRKEPNPRLLRSQSDITRPHYVNYMIPLPLSRQSTPESVDEDEEQNEREGEKEEEEQEDKSMQYIDLTRRYNQGTEETKHDYINMKLLPLRSESQVIIETSEASTPAGETEDGEYIKMWNILGMKDKEGKERDGGDIVSNRLGDRETESVDAVHDYINMSQFHTERAEQQSEPLAITMTKTGPDDKDLSLAGISKESLPQKSERDIKKRMPTPSKNAAPSPDELMAQLNTIELAIQTMLTDSNSKDDRSPTERNRKFHKYVNISIPASPCSSPTKTLARTPSDPNISLTRHLDETLEVFSPSIGQRHIHEAIKEEDEVKMVSEDTLVFIDKSIEGYASEVTVHNWSDGTSGLTSAISQSTVV